MVFGLIYDESIKITVKQGYLNEMMKFQSKIDSTILNLKVLVKLIIYREFDHKIKEKVMHLIFSLYITILAAVVYFPIPLALGKNVIRKLAKIHLIPRESTISIYRIGDISEVITNVGGNLILLSPFIFFICYHFRNITFKIKQIIAMAFTISLFIECSQVGLSYLVANLSRSFDTMDLLCNTISGLLGYYLYKVYSRINISYSIREKVV